MNPHQPQHPFTRPPERTLIHNPNHQPPPAQSSQPPSYAGYSQASQPQVPVHVPFSADPYPSTRRDPFLPSTAQHGRKGSYGMMGGDGPPGSGERHAAWGNTGTVCSRGSSFLEPSAAQPTEPSIVVLDTTAGLRCGRHQFTWHDTRENWDMRAPPLAVGSS
jgi:hypothetical protein